MLITHCLDNNSVQKNVDNDTSFLLTNRKGGFFNLSISSKYRGLFFPFKDEVIKTLDDIRISGKINAVTNNFWNIERNTHSNKESFFMPFNTESLVYELDKEEEIGLLFDVRHPYDSRIWGRNYKITKEKGNIIVEYTKTTDNREDATHGEHEFTVFIVIKANQDSNISFPDEWENQSYSLDKERNSQPSERFVFKGLKIVSKKLIISFSESKKESIKICNKISANLNKFKSLQKKYSKVSIKDTKDKKINLAAKCAIESLDSLLVKTDKETNLYAGLPWFFQFWSRDTLISIKALMLDKEYATVKTILMNLTDNISEDGLLSNRIPESIIKSADSIGWLFKRWDEFISILGKEKILSKYFKKSELDSLINKLEHSMNLIFKNYTIDNLAKNNNQETWMDTLYKGDGRNGARIEIQALRLCMYTLLYKLTNKNIYKDMKEKLLSKVREIFWTGNYLKDGHDDETIRPNIFIAAYLAPELLTKEEWTKCFNHILPKLWLEWGGLATINKSHPDFHNDNAGEDSSSYHHGDSWYWINNLAAITLYRLNYNHFKGYVDKITGASCDEILFNGFIGCHSEISSASQKKSQGCLNQAWSNALFVELIEEMNNSN